MQLLIALALLVELSASRKWLSTEFFSWMAQRRCTIKGRKILFQAKTENVVLANLYLPVPSCKHSACVLYIYIYSSYERPPYSIVDRCYGFLEASRLPPRCCAMLLLAFLMVTLPFSTFLSMSSFMFLYIVLIIVTLCFPFCLRISGHVCSAFAVFLPAIYFFPSLPKSFFTIMSRHLVAEESWHVFSIWIVSATVEFQVNTNALLQ